jgi:hypothetical protein
LFTKNSNKIFSIGIAGGWVCFCVSIIIIGMLTAVIGDLATHVNNESTSFAVFLFIIYL